MKKFTRKFLNNSPKGNPYKDYTEDNAKKVEKLLGVKKKLWYEFIHFSQTNLAKSYSVAGRPISELYVTNLIDISFLAGFVCGWAEKSRKIK